MVATLLPVRPLVGGEEYARWVSLAAQGQVDELFERVMVAHYDPCYARSTKRQYDTTASAAPVHLDALDEASLDSAAQAVIAARG
jgi:tRNA 2-selenouridine synthase